MSARFKTGIACLKETLAAECMGRIKQILQDSAKLKLKDIIISALSQIELYWKALLMPPLILKENLTAMKATLVQFRQKAQEIVDYAEANRNFIIPGLEETLKAKLNEFKMDLSLTVENIFGMDYHYELAQIDSTQFESKGAQISAKELGDVFLEEATALCDELESTLNSVLLYRNESTVEVVTQIYTLNRMTRQLRRTRDLL